MISPIWHGWTTPGNADKYESLLKEEIFVGIQNRQIKGFKRIQLLRRKVGEEVEFVTIMLFDSLDAVREFVGEDYEVAINGRTGNVRGKRPQGGLRKWLAGIF